MKAFFYLKTCSTCKRILDTLDLPKTIELREIKSKPITESELEQLQSLTGSYEALFSKRAQLYKSEGLKDKNLTEADFKHYILQHYTFLKRPVLVHNGHIFIGNSVKTVDAAKEYISTI
ncbi:arsenate reductase family protein [Psychroserpens sp. XS_ASV72]|uniref:arsenate reductase family protein n=1 Tax=Psychroserpens sp. XS_ASV72 TaxID=3241293 RepID=UPI0035145718